MRLLNYRVFAPLLTTETKFEFPSTLNDSTSAAEYPEKERGAGFLGATDGAEDVWTIGG